MSSVPLSLSLQKGPWPYVVLVLLCMALYLPGLSTIPPLDRDESRFAQATAQMLESGDYIQIRFQEEMRAKKPVGAYWLQAMTVSLLSDVETRAIWAYRLPSLLAALASVLLLFAQGQTFAGRRPAFIGAALLGVSFMVVLEAHQAKTDALLLLCTVMCLGAIGRLYTRKREDNEPGLGNALLLWGGVGAGILVKGPVVPMVAALTIVALAFSDRSVDWLKKGFYPISGLLLVAVVTLPWFWAIQSATEGTFIETALREDLLPKLIGGHESHGAWPGYYVLLVNVTFWPASLFLWPSLARSWQLRADPVVRFCFAWLAPAWIVFELVPTKLPHYVLPLYPALALLIGLTLCRGKEEIPSRIAKIWYGIWGLIGLVLAAALGWIAQTYGTGIGIAALVGIILALAAGIIPVFCCWKGQYGKAFFSSLLAGGFTLSLIMGGILPSLEKLGLSARLAAEVHRQGVEETVAVAGFGEPSVVFLLGTETTLTNGAGAARYLATHSDSLAVVSKKEEDSFKNELHQLGKQAISLSILEGFNYSRGQEVRLTLYRLGD